MAIEEGYKRAGSRVRGVDTAIQGEVIGDGGPGKGEPRDGGAQGWGA